jgi:hypothetical protein
MKKLILALLTGILTVVYFSEYAGEYQPFIEVVLIEAVVLWIAFGLLEWYKKIKTKY